MAEVGVQRSVEAPLQGRMAWAWPVIAATWTVNLLRWLDDAPVLVGLALVVVWTWAIGRFVALRTWRVTWDGTIVEVGSRFTRWRFRPQDVTAIVVPTVVTTCAIIRARPMEKTFLGVRSPWPFPWARALPTYVRPQWFTDVVGISPGFVRPNLVRTLFSSKG